MRTRREKSILALLTATLAAASTQAAGHPHVFAEARMEVTVNSDRTVNSLRHVWRFDDLFSSTVLVEFDRNGDLELDAEELKAVADTVHASLAEFNYFQMVTVGREDVAMNPPQELIADLEDNQLIILFESRPKEPLRLVGQVAFGVYDPTFYTAIDFAEDDYLSVANLPDGCTRQVVRPDPEEAIAQNQSSLTEAFFDDPEGNDLSKLFATRLEIACAAEG